MSPRIEATRRTVAKSIGTTAALATLGGTAYLASRTPTARADLAVGSIDIPDAEQNLEDGEQVTSVVLAANVLTTWTIDPAPDAFAVELAVGPDAEVIASTQGGGLEQKTGSREVTLRASLTDASAYAASDFTPDAGQSVTVDVPMAFTAIYYRDGDAVETTTTDATRTVTVHGPPMDTQLGIGASGSFTVVVS